jgi:hypothetical protein
MVNLITDWPSYNRAQINSLAKSRSADEILNQAMWKITGGNMMSHKSHVSSLGLWTLPVKIGLSRLVSPVQ